MNLVFDTVVACVQKGSVHHQVLNCVKDFLAIHRHPASYIICALRAVHLLQVHIHALTPGLDVETHSDVC